MKAIDKIHTELEERWDELRSKHWKCDAQKRFSSTWIVPMLEEIRELDCATEDLLDLCEEAASAAKSVREPDEIDE